MAVAVRAERRRAVLAGMVGLVLVAIVTAVLVWWSLDSARTVRLDAWDDQSPLVSGDGLDVTLTYTGGACDEKSEVRTDESDSRVELTIVTTEKQLKTGEACPAIGIIRTITVHLGDPVGVRELVDGHCAHPDWGDTGWCGA